MMTQAQAHLIRCCMDGRIPERAVVLREQPRSAAVREGVAARFLVGSKRPGAWLLKVKKIMPAKSECMSTCDSPQGKLSGPHVLPSNTLEQPPVQSLIKAGSGYFKTQMHYGIPHSACFGRKKGWGGEQKKSRGRNWTSQHTQPNWP